MNWIPLQHLDTLDEIDILSKQKPVVIFKHSTTCSISAMAKMRLESSWNLDNVAVYYLDLLSYRPISQAIAERYKVHHESPQIILIKDGRSFHDASHFDITVEEVAEVLAYNNLVS